MKKVTMRKKIALGLVVCTLALLRASYGADFKNLGFDEGDLSSIKRPDTGGAEGPADPAKALAGWSLLRGGERYRVVYVNELFLDIGDVVVLSDYRHFTGRAEGKYTLFFHRDDDSSPVWTLEQTGTIPAGTKYLTYSSRGSARMQVQINDDILTPLDWPLPPFDSVVPERGPNVVYDVSAYAGQEVKLALVGPYGPCDVFDCIKEADIDSLLFLEDVPKINAVVEKAPSTTTNIVTLSFKPIPGRDIDVEYRDDMSRSNVWTYLPRSLATPGGVVDQSLAEHRTYRLRISVPFQSLP